MSAGSSIRWKDLNDLWTSIYLGTASSAKEKLQILIAKAKNGKDRGIVKMILYLNDQLKNVNVSEKLVWSTSNVGNRMYPPIEANKAAPILWDKDNSIVRIDHSIKLKEKYTNMTPISINSNNDLNGIEQCPDLPNCSLVASIININNHKLKMPETVSISNNCFHVNLCFNGSTNRLVSVDANNIPTDKYGSQLALRSNNIMDKIIELAYMQILGGSYETLGSNVAIDTYRLIGFLPEIVTPSRYSFKTLSSYFNSGLCLMALGTGDDEIGIQSRLLKNHDYCILDIAFESNEILLQDPLNSKSPIRIDYNDFLKLFSQLYINWNPSKLFKNHKSLMFHYNSPKINTFASNIDKPIFTLKNNSQKSETVWILLESHLTESSFSSNEIAYIQQLSDNIFEKLHLPNDSASNIGFQLVKLELIRQEKKNFLCFSETSRCFTIHLFSVGTAIEMSKCDNNKFAQSLEFTEPLHNMKYDYTSNYYFLNPTFEIEMVTPLEREELLSLQLLSEHEFNLLNLQIFDAPDLSLSKPIIFDNHYSTQEYCKFNIPLLTNHKYRCICSSKASSDDLERFKIVASLSYGSREGDAVIKLTRINPTFGGMLYQTENKFNFMPNSSRLKLSIQSESNNTLFIRLVINDNDSIINEVRCNVFDHDTHEKIYYDDKFYPKGLVIASLRVNKNQNPVLLIEIEETVNRNIPVTLYLGSKSKATVQELKSRSLP